MKIQKNWHFDYEKKANGCNSLELYHSLLKAMHEKETNKTT